MTESEFASKKETPETPTKATKATPIWVEATANLPDLPRGERVLADPTSEWIQDHLRTGLLVRVHPSDA